MAAAGTKRRRSAAASQHASSTLFRHLCRQRRCRHSKRLPLCSRHPPAAASQLSAAVLTAAAAVAAAAFHKPAAVPAKLGFSSLAPQPSPPSPSLLPPFSQLPHVLLLAPSSPSPCRCRRWLAQLLRLFRPNRWAPRWWCPHALLLGGVSYWQSAYWGGHICCAWHQHLLRLVVHQMPLTVFQHTKAGCIGRTACQQLRSKRATLSCNEWLTVLLWLSQLLAAALEAAGTTVGQPSVCRSTHARSHHRRCARHALLDPAAVSSSFLCGGRRVS